MNNKILNLDNTKAIAIVFAIAIVIALAFLFFSSQSGLVSLASSNENSNDTIKVGWISALTGPVAKYGAMEAGQLAVEKINANGGINGKKLELVVEDGAANGKTAATAMKKLIEVDEVRIVLGGHNTPESLSIAPIAQANNVLMLASITTSPGLTNAGDFVFRTSPVSTVQAVLDARYAFNKAGVKSFAIVFEQTDYARPIAEKMKEEFSNKGGQVVLFESYSPGTTDFKSLLALVKNKNPDAVFLSAQSPDSAFNFVKQLTELGINAKLFGNEVAAIQVNIDKMPAAFEGFVGAFPDFNTAAPKTKAFIEEYNAKYHTKDLPYGIWTAESYDAVMIIADAIAKNGQDIEKIKEYLYNLKDYDGVSGKISIDKNGDGLRQYSLKTIHNGKLVKLEN
jgi:branched-chain amino acid transport system substrate-binding protein